VRLTPDGFISVFLTSPPDPDTSFFIVADTFAFCEQNIRLSNSLLSMNPPCYRGIILPFTLIADKQIHIVYLVRK
jgi:hypothetical protein